MSIMSISVEGLLSILDRKRQMENLSWRQVAQTLGVSPSTITRMRQGKSPDANSFATFVVWTGLPIHSFVTSEDGSAIVCGNPDPMVAISALLRSSDPPMMPDAICDLEAIIQAALRMAKRGDIPEGSGNGHANFSEGIQAATAITGSADIPERSQ